VAQQVRGWRRAKAYTTAGQVLVEVPEEFEWEGSAYQRRQYRVREWRPSQKIEHAWQVVERLRREHYQVRIDVQPDTYDVYVTRLLSPYESVVTIAQAPFPVAVCRAAVKATAR
jgi:hypothetical protein